MFDFLQPRRGSAREHQKKVKEVVSLKVKLDQQQYKKIVSIDALALFPLAHKFDTYKVILIMMAHFKLQNFSKVEKIAESVLFNGGLNLFNKVDRSYLQAAVLILMFDDNSSVPKQFQHLEIKIPDLDLVDDAIKQMFLLQVGEAVNAPE